MKATKIVITIVIIIIVTIGFNKVLFSWGLFNLFSDTRYSDNGLKKVETFNPDKDILYLPEIKEKDIFSASRDLSICRKKAVRKHLYKYLTSHRPYVIRAIEKSYLYQDIIEDIFKKNRDIPKEIAMLPLLESGFDPYAVSKSNAVGLWQFMRNTSGPLGLKKDKWRDERRNIRKSTSAALRHLRNLHRIFKSWDLALAAYNGGGGYVKRALKKTGTKNIWDLRKSGTLREETSEYVPRFLALLLIYNNQRLFGVKDEIKIPEAIDVERIALKKPVNLKDVSKITGIPVKTIKNLNPELKQNVTPPTVKKYSLQVPPDAKDRLLKNKKKLYKYKITRIKRHRVRKGECLSVIARRYKKKPV